MVSQSDCVDMALWNHNWGNLLLNFSDVDRKGGRSRLRSLSIVMIVSVSLCGICLLHCHLPCVSALHENLSMGPHQNWDIHPIGGVLHWLVDVVHGDLPMIGTGVWLALWGLALKCEHFCYFKSWDDAPWLRFIKIIISFIHSTCNHIGDADEHQLAA